MGAKNTRVDDFETAIRAVCEPIFDKPLKEISFGRYCYGYFRHRASSMWRFSLSWSCCKRPY